MNNQKIMKLIIEKSNTFKKKKKKKMRFENEYLSNNIEIYPFLINKFIN